MKVEDNRKDTRKEFKEILTGEVFEYKNCVYIRLSKVLRDENNIRRFYNAISLNKGMFTEFCDYDMVYPLNAKIVIDNKEEED